MKVVQLLGGFGMNQPIAYDPFVGSEKAEAAGVKLVGLNELMAQADFVSIHCPLTEGTRNSIGPDQIAMMKPTAYLINSVVLDRPGFISKRQRLRIAD